LIEVRNRVEQLLPSEAWFGFTSAAGLPLGWTQ
jgi:hypothetical protein